MQHSITNFRSQLFSDIKSIQVTKSESSNLNFLGITRAERIENLVKKIFPTTKGEAKLSALQQHIFEYIVDFWEKAYVSLDFMKDSARGVNLAKRPFLSPSVPVENTESFSFAEQYRWDTYFHNRGFILAGGIEAALNQLLNLADVFQIYHRIPNALSSAFLSHSQPPLEMYSIAELLENGTTFDDRIRYIVQTLEQELFIEWLDFGRGKGYMRQTKELVDKYGIVTRHTNLHFHPLIAGCEDGKDHNWVTVQYGSNYLPVQLNAIIYGILDRLEQFYRSEHLGNDANKAKIYSDLKKQFYEDFQKIFWVEEGKWAGFRNYSIEDNKTGPILYGDLAAEVFPLFTKIATPAQAEITKNNLQKYYSGDYGLSATSLELRKGGSIEHAPDGEWEFQWEYPNCWAPLMLIAVQGLKNYGYIKEALDYEKRWVEHVEHRFEKTGVFAEKYTYSSGLEMEEGFYGNVKGFGWTISTYLEFLKDMTIE